MAHTARFVVDATGRAATVARRCSLRALNFDTLVGCCLHAASSSDGTEGLMIETFAEGWWYTAADPRGGRVIACMTDADRVRPLGLSCGEGLERLLAETKHVQQVVDISRPIDRPKIYPAGSRRLQGKTTLPLLCVGDAAMCYDPVSGQGIIKALRSGIFAAYAIGDLLGNGDVRALALSPNAGPRIQRLPGSPARGTTLRKGAGQTGHSGTAAPQPRQRRATRRFSRKA